MPALALATASVGRRQNAAEPRVKPRSGLREFFLADPCRHAADTCRTFKTDKSRARRCSRDTATLVGWMT